MSDNILNKVAPVTGGMATLAEVDKPAGLKYQVQQEQVHNTKDVYSRIVSGDGELPVPDFMVASDSLNPETPTEGSEESDSVEAPKTQEAPLVPEQFGDPLYVGKLKQTKELLKSFEAERLEKEKKETLGNLFSPTGNESILGMALRGVWDATFAKVEEETYEKPEDQRSGLRAIYEDAKAGFFGQNLHPERQDKTAKRIGMVTGPFEAVGAAVTAPFAERGKEVQAQKDAAKEAIQKAVEAGEPIPQELIDTLNTPIPEGDGFGTDDFLEAIPRAKEAFLQKFQIEYDRPNTDFGKAVMESQAPNLSEGSKTAGGIVIDMLTDPTAITGLFSLKLAQLGLKKAKDVDPSATYKGIMQEGVAQLADDIKRISSIEADPSKLTELGQLAARADTGDIEALTELNVKLSQMPQVAEHFKGTDVLEVMAQNNEIDEILGSANGPAFKISDTEMGQELEINLSTFNDDADIDNLIDQFAKRSEQDIKRYGLDEEKFIELSEAAGVEIQNLLGKPVKDYMPHEIIAYRQAIQTTAAQLGKAAKAADAPNATPLQQAAYEKTLGIFSALANKATDANLQQSQLRDLYKITQKGGVKRVNEIMGMVENVGEGGTTLNALRKALAQQNDPEALAKTAASVSRLERLPGAYMEILVNSTISSLDTQATNIKSNMALALMQPVETYTKALSAVARGDIKQAQTHAADGIAQVAGLSEGLADTLKMAFTKSTWDSQGLPAELKQTAEIARQEVKHKLSSDHLDLTGPFGALTDVMGKVVRVPGQALLVADRGFKTLNYRMQIHSTAARAARAAGTNPDDAKQIYNTLKNNPNDDMITEAVDVANQNTFTQSLGNGRARDFQNLLSKTPMAQPFFMFFKTTTNIFKRGLKDSAPGVLKQHGIHILEKSARGDTARARIALGFAAPTALVASLDNSEIVGRLDYNDPHDRFMIDQGVPEYSIRTGSDENGKPTYFQYGKFEPLRAILGLAANYKSAINSYRKIDPETGQENPVGEELLKVMAAPFVHTYTDNYMIENVGGALGLIDAFNTGKEELIAKEIERLTTSVVFNNFASNINNKYIDGTFRYADDSISRIKNRIAILSKQNSAQVTAWGDSRIRPRNVGVDYMSSTVSLGQAFDKWDEEIVNNGVMLDEPPKKIDAGDGIILKLSGKMRTEYGILRGKGIPGEPETKLGGELKPQFIDLISSDDYQTKMSAKERRQALQDMWTNRSAAVKEYMLSTNPELLEQYKEKVLLMQMQAERTRNNPTRLGERP